MQDGTSSPVKQRSGKIKEGRYKMKKTIRQIILLTCLAFAVTAVMAGCGSKASAKYLNWTAADWQAADDAEKQQCAVSYTAYAAELAGIEDGAEQIENMSDEKLEAVISALDTLFKESQDKSLKECLE